MLALLGLLLQNLRILAAQLQPHLPLVIEPEISKGRRPGGHAFGS